MKLTDILQSPPGRYIWLYRDESKALLTPKDAAKRVHAYCQQPKYQEVTASTTALLVIPTSEPENIESAVLITIS